MRPFRFASVTAIIALVALVGFPLVGCSKEPSRHEPTPPMHDEAETDDAKSEETVSELAEDQAAALTSFSFDVFRQIAHEDNVLVSPYSVAHALGMVSLGAESQTKAQFENVFGMSVDTLASALGAEASLLPNDEYARLETANSLWIRDDAAPSDAFIASVQNRYSACVEQAPFNDATKMRINSWVNDQTDGMIKEMLDQINPSALMYLINAVAFDARWSEPYGEKSVFDETFTTADGQAQQARMMHSDESLYLEDDQAKGFVKSYSGNAYAFVALLPHEGISFDDYVASLDGQKFRTLVQNAQFASVKAKMPAFEIEYGAELSSALGALGLTDAFDEQKADFSGICETGDLSISSVSHKAYIAVNEQGTRAGAATSVEMRVTSAIASDDPKQVYLDRPFVYAIIDTSSNLPLFIGTVDSLA